jgi:primosomal protein N' (replication factor Y)
MLNLTVEQQSALTEIAATIGQKSYAAFLLHGVTGSGKTEIYIRAMRETLRHGQSALMLVPEISLTPMFARRLRDHFGAEVAILHSSLSEGERLDEWNRLRRGEARICIGARSAVFAPLANLGLIVVDEEHESSCKQDESPRYHGRDTAIMRANLAGAVVIIGSATPSMESYHNAQTGKYRYLRLEERIGGRELAQVEMVDMRQVFARHGKQQIFSDEMKAAITHDEGAWRTDNRAASIGAAFHRFTICRGCGHTARCPNCDVTLTFHKQESRLVCHYCNYQDRVPARLSGLSRTLPFLCRRRDRADRVTAEGALSRNADRAARPRHDTAAGSLREGARRIRPRRDRPAGRNADDREGARFPQRHAGLRHLGRCRAWNARLSLGRTDVPASDTGRRAGRARREGRAAC